MMIIIIDKQQVVNFEKNENFKNKNLRQIDNFVRTTKLATYSHCATKMNGEKKNNNHTIQSFASPKHTFYSMELNFFPLNGSNGKPCFSYANKKN